MAARRALTHLNSTHTGRKRKPRCCSFSTTLPTARQMVRAKVLQLQHNPSNRKTGGASQGDAASAQPFQLQDRWCEPRCCSFSATQQNTHTPVANGGEGPRAEGEETKDRHVLQLEEEKRQRTDMSCSWQKRRDKGPTFLRQVFGIEKLDTSSCSL